MNRQADCLDYTVDNPVTRRREIYRDGALKACVPRTCLNTPLVKTYGVEGPWGTYPPQNHDEQTQLHLAIEVVRSSNRPSISRVQHELRIDYVTASKLVERMEAMGIVSPADERGLREVTG